MDTSRGDEAARSPQSGGVSHADLAERIEQALRDGDFRDPAGAPVMPSQAALAAHFKVGRHHVRKAEALLAERRVLDLHQGRLPRDHGLPMVEYRIKSRTRWTDNLAGLGGEPRFRVREARSRRATGTEAARLGLRPLGRVIDVRVERSWGDRVVCLASHHFPEDRFAGLESAVHEVERISDLHRHFGIPDYLRNDTEITARKASPAERSVLGLGRSDWVLTLAGRNVDLTGRPIELSNSVWPAHLLRILF